jgi:hypothetical protein
VPSSRRASAFECLLSCFAGTEGSKRLNRKSVYAA